MAKKKSKQKCPLPSSTLKDLRKLRLEVAQLPRFNENWAFTWPCLPGILQTRYRFGKALRKAVNHAEITSAGYTIEQMAEDIGTICDEEIYFHLDLVQYCLPWGEFKKKFIEKKMTWYRICREVIRKKRGEDPERYRSTPRGGKDRA